MTVALSCRPSRWTDLMSAIPAAGEGFPRSDIDVVAVRAARHRYAILQTDYSALMAQLEAKLHALHALPLATREALPAAKPAVVVSSDVTSRPAPSSAPAVVGADGGAIDADESERSAPVLGVERDAIGLAMVQGVQPGGPGFAAGLRAGDAVLRLGTATADNSPSLAGLPLIVQASAGSTLECVVRRGTDDVHALLIRVPNPPQLGLHLVPVVRSDSS